MGPRRGEPGREAGAPPTPAADLEPGYYPAVGWPEGTVVGWDGDRWREPVTVPGYYERPGGAVHWWNGRSWVPDIVAGRPRALPAASSSSAPRRGRRAHRRRRRGGWQARAAGATSAAAAVAMLLIARLH